MTRILSLFACSFIITVIVFAQQTNLQQPQITVNGSVELKEVADQASLTFSVKGVGPSLRLAVQHATEKMEQLRTQLGEVGVGPNQFSTSNFYSGVNFGDKAFLSSSRDYRAIITAEVKVDSLRLIQVILYSLADAEVENVSNIKFLYKDELGLRRRARVAAATKAREKADDIAKALGASVAEVIQIEEIQINYTYRTENSNTFYPTSILQQYPNPFNSVRVNTVDKPDIDESRGSELFAQTVSAQSQVRVTFKLK